MARCGCRSWYPSTAVDNAAVEEEWVVGIFYCGRHSRWAALEEECRSRSRMSRLLRQRRLLQRSAVGIVCHNLSFFTVPKIWLYGWLPKNQMVPPYSLHEKCWGIVEQNWIFWEKIFVHPLSDTVPIWSGKRNTGNCSVLHAILLFNVENSEDDGPVVSLVHTRDYEFANFASKTAFHFLQIVALNGLEKYLSYLIKNTGFDCSWIGSSKLVA